MGGKTPSYPHKEIVKLFFLMTEGYHKTVYIFLPLKMDRPTKRSSIVNKHY